MFFFLIAGSPCDNFRGYCDVFLKCKSYNALGPLARLASNLFSQQTVSIITDFLYVSIPFLILIIIPYPGVSAWYNTHRALSRFSLMLGLLRILT